MKTINQLVKCLPVIVIFGGVSIEMIDFFANRHSLGEYIHDDMGLTIDELIRKHGYQVENHTLITQDGYVIEMHRLYNEKLGSSRHFVEKNNGKVALFMHGVMHSSLSWLTGGPKNSLAYHFADHDYDVWLGNIRGNTYSRQHIRLHPDAHSRQFFNYSWHEFGVYDVPAQIDYVLAQTHQSKLFYVGHSQGYLGLLVALSERPYYNEKIHLLIGLAPAVYLNYAYSPFIRTIAYFQDLFEVSKAR